MINPKIYIAHPISGGSADEVFQWFDDIGTRLRAMGFQVMSPLSGKGHLRTELRFRAEGYDHPLSGNHAIFERDKWMCEHSDFMLTDLTGATKPSIGCAMELAWASAKGNHTIVVMEKDNTHRHAFVLEAADVVFETLEEAMTYLVGFMPGEE